MAPKRALLSVHDKNGIVPFATALHKLGFELLASGNTARLLREHHVPVRDVSEFTGSPELLEGRVKTLHPKVHGGILFKRKDPAHAKAASDFSIDLVCVNFYPFEETLKKSKDPAEILENIDIGGPALARAAAKNHEDVIVVTSPSQYEGVMSKLGKSGDLSADERKTLAAAAFACVTQYDIAISNYFSGFSEKMQFPPVMNMQLRKIQDLRYGENPHQSAASYSFASAPLSLRDLEQLNGKQLSYNNILDIQAALELIYEFKGEKKAVAVIFKHTNPTGGARSDSMVEAFRMAYAADALSAFGGAVVFNRKVDGATAQEAVKNFIELVIAPDFEKDALETFKGKKNLRVMKAGKFLSRNIYAEPKRISVVGGVMLQTPDYIENEFDMRKFKVPTKRKPTAKEIEALEFAWKFMGHIRSNTVVFSTDAMLLAVGCGQQSRVDACAICIEKTRRANLQTKGAVMASEAFFPFRDTVDFAASAGISAIIQPGGSIRDPEVVSAADGHGIAMVFTGIRHFKH